LHVFVAMLRRSTFRWIQTVSHSKTYIAG